jgi:gliding motility-associated-like protein
VETGDTIILRVIGENGCAADTLVIPEIDTIPPIAIIQPLDEILCQDRIVRLDASSSIGEMLTYNWGTTNGEITSNPDAPIVMVNDEGIYQLVLLNGVNGCSDTANYQVLESQNSIFDLSYSILEPICTEDETGTIEVGPIVGGRGGFVYFLDGMSQSMPVFQGITPGTYLLSVVDSVGCQFDTTLFFPTPSSISIDLGDPQLIYIGETASLTAQINVDSSQVQQIFWRPDIGMSACSTCLTYEVSPLETTTFTATVQDTIGCLASDDIQVQVIEKGNLYIPNIFSPNDDGNNDVVRIFTTQGIAQFDFFRIFDRWGNQVFGAENFTASDTPAIFWDGKLENSEMMPAVFTYVIKYRLVNGKEELTTGDILLIR